MCLLLQLIPGNQSFSDLFRLIELVSKGSEPPDRLGGTLVSMRLLSLRLPVHFLVVGAEILRREWTAVNLAQNSKMIADT